MRPGRPTRVIDVREQNKRTEAQAETDGDAEAVVKDIKLDGCSAATENSGHTSSSCSRSQQDLGPDVQDSLQSKGGSSIVLLNSTSTSPSLCDHNHCRYHHHIEQHQQHHHMLDELHKSSSNRSSRSCSVSSDLPLLAATQCPTCGDILAKDEGKPESCRCLCQSWKEDNVKGATDSNISIPSATTITATPEFNNFQVRKKNDDSGAVRHVQVVSLHNHCTSLNSSRHLQSRVDSNPSNCLPDNVSSLSPFTDRCPRPLSLPDETTVFLSSGSSSVLTGSGGSSDKVTTSRLSLPYHLVHPSQGTPQTQAEITSLSLNVLPSHTCSPRTLHSTFIDTPITYLGSDCKEEGKAKDRKHKYAKESRRKGGKCSIEAIAPLSCDVLLPAELVSTQNKLVDRDPDLAISRAALSGPKVCIEMEPSNSKHLPLCKSRDLEEDWHKACSITDRVAESFPSESTHQFDSVLTTHPASTVLFSEHSPPPPPRRAHRRSNDYTCKHL